MIERAFDELRFGTGRTLNLRELLPTPEWAVAHATQWLQRLQMEGASEALVITGRGNGSRDGVSVVREAVARQLAHLRRRNVLATVGEHSPGSFVVTFAPVRALAEAPRRQRERVVVEPAAPPALAALDEETVALLRTLATTALAALGVRGPTRDQLEHEMVHQCATLAAALPPEGDREVLLRQAMMRALTDYETEP
jgi:hypothetical protein